MSTITFEFRRVEELSSRAHLIMDLVGCDNLSGFRGNHFPERFRVGSFLVGRKETTPQDKGIYYMKPGWCSKIPQQVFLGLVQDAVEMVWDTSCAPGTCFCFSRGIFSVKLWKRMTEITPFFPSVCSPLGLLNMLEEKSEFPGKWKNRKIMLNTENLKRKSPGCVQVIPHPISGDIESSAQDRYRIVPTCEWELSPDFHEGGSNPCSCLDHLIYHWNHRTGCAGFKVLNQLLVVQYALSPTRIMPLPAGISLDSLISRALIILMEDICTPKGETVKKRLDIEIGNQEYDFTFEIVMGASLMIRNNRFEKNLR